jgi:hypothetical protein
MDKKLNPDKKHNSNEHTRDILTFRQPRKVTPQNDSFVMTLPHVFVDSCLDDSMQVKVEMKGKQLIVTPVSNRKKKEI